ncbi:MAG: hypothetical protein IPK73_30480 [Candidatus Obscuribacter sp.]|nr:hypothetical protein [Candidatus Obscuribacter sp.]
MLNIDVAILVVKSLNACEKKAKRLSKSNKGFRDAINKRQGAYLGLLADRRSDFMRECRGRPEHHIRLGFQRDMASRNHGRT